MDYELYLYCLIFFILGRLSKGFKIYIGSDIVKYNKSNIGILLRKG